MTMVEHKEICSLCGQTVEIEGFTLTTREGKSKFCCAGCLSIYQLLYQDPLTHNNKPSKNED